MCRYMGVARSTLPLGCAALATPTTLSFSMSEARTPDTDLDTSTILHTSRPLSLIEKGRVR